MKKYRLDEDPWDPDTIWTDDQAPENKGDRPDSIWVEEIVKIFGETHYTEKYSLMSRKKLRKMNLWTPPKPLLTPPKPQICCKPKTSSTEIKFRIVHAFRD
jgi:hypothetical protein